MSKTISVHMPSHAQEQPVVKIKCQNDAWNRQQQPQRGQSMDGNNVYYVKLSL
jgi:hypothetical protein